jgi:hypothetical protein
MAESIAQRTNAMTDNASAGELYVLFQAVRADIESLRAAVLEMGTKLDAEALAASDYNADAAATLGTQQTVA